MPTAKPPSSKDNPTGRRGRSRHLDRAGIVAAARALARERGEPGLTMRGIARRLGVDPAALYWHFESKADLLDAIAHDAVRDALDARALEVADEGPWPDRARALCHAIAERLRGDPALQVMGTGDGSLGPFIARATGTAARILRDAGLDGEALFFAAHTLVHTVTSVLSAQATQRRSEPEGIRRYMRGVAEALPERESAQWLAVARSDPEHSFDAYLDHAIDVVLAGIDATARAKARPGPG